MVIGTLRSDWNVEDVNANNSSIPAKFKLIIDVTTIVLLDPLADPQNNWIEISI